MDSAALFQAVDALLIYPYRLFGSAHAGLWLGTAVLSIWCIILGELALTAIYLFNRDYYTRLNQKMVRMHNISIQAILQKDKENFKAANRWANEYFGKVFFAHAALFAVSIWPLPFAMGWMQTRFEGIDIYTIPYFDLPLGYTFVMLTCYIALRFTLGKLRTRIPLLRRVEQMRIDDAATAGMPRSWADLGVEKPNVTTDENGKRTLILSRRTTDGADASEATGLSDVLPATAGTPLRNDSIETEPAEAHSGMQPAALSVGGAA